MGSERQDALLEREAELERLGASCRRAAGGDGSVVAIEGLPGVGKTALLDAASRQAERRGMVTLRASGAELERELAFGVVRQLFERLLRRLSDADRTDLLAGAAQLSVPVVLDPEPVAARPEGMQTAMHGVYWLAAELAERQPLLLVVDDAHWADAASLRWLAYLARRLDGVPLMVVIASRVAEPGAETALLRQVLAEAGADTLRLAPLSRTAVERWLAHTYGRAPAAEFAQGCWTATGGNPLLLRELTKELRAEGLDPDADAAGRLEGLASSTIVRSVLMRLARLGSDAVGVAEMVAVLSQDARIDRVAALAATTVPRVAAIVDGLVASGILADGDPVEFAHPLLRTAVYDQIPSARRGLAHADAARRLVDDGAGAERAASHLLLAPAGGDAAVVDLLRKAAAAVMARGAPEAAVTLLERALVEPPSEPASVLLELAAAEAIAQESGAIEHACEAIATAPTASQRVRGALIAANAMLRVGRAEDALGVLAAAERDPDGLDEVARRDVAVAALLTSAFYSAAGMDERLAAMGVDELAGDTATDRLLLALRSMDLVVRAQHRDQALALARRAIAGEDVGDPSHEFVVGALARVFALGDQLDEASRILDALIDGGRTRGAVSRVAVGCMLRAEVEVYAGRLIQAEADAREALDLALECGLWSTPGAAAWLMAALVERDTPEAALEVIDACRIDVEDLPPIAATAGLLHARAVALTAAGNPAAAVADLRASARIQARFGDVNPASVPWRSSLSLALMLLGELPEARGLADEDLELAQRFGAPRAIGVALRTRALLERGNAVIRGLEEAVRTLADSPARLDHARALVDLGAALRRVGRRTDARETLAAGLDAADRCGSHRLVAQARGELHAAGARPRRERITGRDALTASERRVAELAATGLSNRQIAQSLFVTAKTVEMHLGRAYLKLGIDGRRQLVAALELAGSHAAEDAVGAP